MRCTARYPYNIRTIRRQPRGLILPVVLLILALLGLLACSFNFQVNADCAATQALINKMQTRLAAEAGYQYVTLFLRENINNTDAWYDNREKMRAVVVWSSTGGQSSFGAVEESEADSGEKTYEPTYRFSIVADDPNDDEIKIRYGITDESSKLNINTATADQLTRLFKKIVPEEIPVGRLVNSLLDWRDEDESPRVNGAESDYYRQRKVPYRCKNAAFETVEELLMVQGFTGQILYGEDADRNGLLSPNEDDGEASFPPDDADGELNLGLYPYLTVYSADDNRTADGSRRILLAGDSEDARAGLEEHFTLEQTDFLLSSESTKNRSLTGLLGTASSNGVSSPFGLGDFQDIVNYCTYNPAPEIPGLININTAPAVVLFCLGNLTEEEVTAIIEKRAELNYETKQTTAWLLTQGVLDRDRYEAIADSITARGMQFNVEVIGYGDHIGARTRLQIVFALRGPVPQIMYYRDLTHLGVTYPLTREEEETGGFADGPDGTTTG